VADVASRLCTDPVGLAESKNNKSVLEHTNLKARIIQTTNKGVHDRQHVLEHQLANSVNISFPSSVGESAAF